MIQKLDIRKRFPDADHHFVGYFSDPDSGLSGFVAIHRAKGPHPSFGATRMMPYENADEALRDALRLSRLMSYKAALSDLPYGGAKAVIIGDPLDSRRKTILRSYANHVNSLRGKFVTGSDIGLSDSDVHFLGSLSKYVVGKETDPARHTVLGLFLALQVALRHVFGSSDIRERTFAIQGLGKIGMGLFKLLAPQAKYIYISDPDERKIQEAQKFSSWVTPVPSGEIHASSADVFSPCALGSALTRNNAEEVKAKIVVGGANNQLEDDSVASVLHARNILYAPDYVVNAGGLISVASEFEGQPEEIHVSRRVGRIGETLDKILRESERRKEAPVLVSNRMAEASIRNHNKITYA